MEKLTQSCFAEIDSSWGALTSSGTELQKYFAWQYQKATQHWQSLDLDLPQGCKLIEFGRSGYVYRAEPVFTTKNSPTIGDVDFPDSLVKILEAYGNHTGYGHQTYVSDLALFELYGHYPFNPEKDLATFNRLVTLNNEGEDSWVEHNPVWQLLKNNPDLAFEIAEKENEYQNWFRDISSSWWNQSGVFSGWHASVQDLDHKSLMFNFHFNQQRELERLSIRKPFGVEKQEHTPLPNLPSTRMEFRDQQLVSFWLEVRNGTFFPDPKGSKDQIYPYWVNGIYKYPPDRETPGTPEAWERYLDRIKRREPVISPKSWDYVRQTERQARQNLEQWRDRIYYKTDQVLHVKSLRRKPGFRAEAGYGTSGRFGQFVSRKSRAYRQLDAEETLKMLEQWDPLQLEFNLEQRSAHKTA